MDSRLGFFLLLLAGTIGLNHVALAEQDYFEKAKTSAKTIAERNLCGSFAVVGKARVFDKLLFGKDNNVQVSPAMNSDAKYFIVEEAVIIRDATGFSLLRIMEDDQLFGTEGWTKGDIYKKTQQGEDVCHSETPRKKYIEELANELCFADGNFLRLEGKLKAAQTKYLECCEMGDAQSCNTYGSLVALLEANKKTAAQYFRQSCDMGYGGGCSNLAEVETRKGNHKEAMELHQEACEKGKRESCMKADPELYDLLLP